MKFQNKITGEVVEWTCENINSALLSAQNRNRLYWTNLPVSQPEDKGITWGDVREHGVETKKYYYTEKAMQWLARVSQKKNKTLDVHLDSEKMQMVEASHYKKYSNQRFFGIIDYPTDTTSIAAIRGRPVPNEVKKNKCFIEFRYNDKSNCLTTSKSNNVVVPFTLSNRVPQDEFFFRYVTPLECERLQTVPDLYTQWGNFDGKVKQISDTQRYKMLGNGWTMAVIAHILKGMLDVTPPE